MPARVCAPVRREAATTPPRALARQGAVVFKQTDSSGHVRVAHCAKKPKDTFCCNPDVTVTQLWEHPRILVIQVPGAKAAPRYGNRNELFLFSSSQQLLAALL